MHRRVSWNLKYSLRTVALAFEALSTMASKGKLKLRLLRYDPGLKFGEDTMAGICSYAMQMLLERNPSAIEQVIEDIAKEGPETETFLNSLKADGFDVSSSGEIVPLLATAVTPAREESVLEERLSELGWDQAKQHLSEGISSYEHGNWAAANSQFRTFLEAVFNEIVKCNGGSTKGGGAARQFLEQSGFLSKEEGEMIKGMFSLLNTKGSHPGLLEEFETRMRRYLTEVVALYVIEKFNSAL